MGIDFSDYLKSTADKKNPVTTVTNMVQHPTGFMYLDYGCGSYLTVYDEDETPVKQYHNVGITSGSVNVIISKTQGGKTSLAIEMGMAIIEPYISKFLYQKHIEALRDKKHREPDTDGMPFIQILDTEKTLPIDYVKKLTKYKNSWLNKYVTINQITTDTDCMKAIESHIKYKVEHMAIDVAPIPDVFGKPIMEYPPTVIILDSATQLLIEDVDDPMSKKGGVGDVYGNATQNTAGARRAKIISALYSQMVNYAKRYNIVIFSVNHINKAPAMMGIPVKQFAGLRAGESLSGGERAIYLASNILRLDRIKNIGGSASSAINMGEDVTGHIVIASWIKSKSNSKRNTCQMVYDNIDGYDQLLSTLWNAKELGTLAKSGNFYHLDEYPQYRFTFKNYKDVFSEHPEMFVAYYNQFRDECAKMLDNPEAATIAAQKEMDKIRKDIRKEGEAMGYTKSDMMDLDDIYSGMVND